MSLVIATPPPLPTLEHHYDALPTKIDMWLTPYTQLQLHLMESFIEPHINIFIAFSIAFSKSSYVKPKINPIKKQT